MDTGMFVVGAIFHTLFIAPPLWYLVPVIILLPFGIKRRIDKFTFSKYLLVFFVIQAGIFLARNNNLFMQSLEVFSISTAYADTAEEVSRMMSGFGRAAEMWVYRFPLNVAICVFLRQRMVDLGWNRLWSILMAIPIVSPIFILVLALKTPAQKHIENDT
jgi:hypothetical protein